MRSDTSLDYAVFELSPRHSRCELFVSGNGTTEKLASGLVKPFVTHLKVAEAQVAQAVDLIKLEVGSHRNAETWFTKGTLERFVRFVSTPEVLEKVNTSDAEMSQLEGARRIYSQGAGGQVSSSGEDGAGSLEGVDATKKELVRAIDVRLSAVRQDFFTACARASAAGFNPETVLELQLFADYFGAYRLNDACTKYISLCQRRGDLINQWKPHVEDQAVRSSWGSDMSIDDPNEDPSGSHQPSFQGKHLAGQEQRSLDATIQPQTRQQTSSSSLSEQQKKEKKEEGNKEGAGPESSPGPPSQPSRRLSVQDRISLFESKQKENSGGKSISVGKSVELRRLSSDVSSAPAAEKAVLRRWSGASDMSIDVGNDKKDGNNTDSPLCTPSSSSVAPQAKGTVFLSSSKDNIKDPTGLHDPRAASGLKDQGELQTTSFEGKGPDLELKDYKGNWKDQGGSQVGADSYGFREERSGVTLGREDSFGGAKDPEVIEGKPNHSQLRVPDGEFRKRAEDTEVRDLPNHSRLRNHGRSHSGQFEGGLGGRSKNLLHKEVGGDQSASQSQWRAFNSEAEQAGKKDVSYSGRESTKGENLEVPTTVKMQKPVSSGAEQMKKLGDRNDESGVPFGGSKPVTFGKRIPDLQESHLTAQASSVEQFQRVRQSKGNQELNDELKMKANELEKLFAEHKLRVPVDQSNSNRRNKPTEIQVEQPTSSSIQKRPAAVAAVEISPMQFQIEKVELEGIGNSETLEFSTPPPTKMLDQPDYSNTLRRNFSDLSFSDDSRGKFYETYMKKRDEKLREEWGTKRVEKEAKLKAMHDSLDRSRAEMKAKFSASADKQDSRARRRTEKLRSFSVHSSVKKQQLPVDLIQSEEDEDLPDYSEQFYAQEKTFTESAGQNKKFTPNRNVSSSTPRTAAGPPVPRSAVKSTNPSSGKRRAPSENHLAQSVPNFSEFRKENTKPFTGAGKTANRSQVRTYSRSKSNGEDVPPTKEDNKSRRSQSSRKSTAAPPEFKELSPLTTDATVLAPLKSDKDQAESKTFLKKGNGIGPGAGPGMVKLKASSAVSEALISEDEFEDSAFEMEDNPDVARDVAEEELETTEVEDCTNVDNNGKSRLSQESEKMVMSESDNSDLLRSQVDISSVVELPAPVPSAFSAVDDSPAESPVSWNMHHPFSYQHETSDVDAFVDSPMGSPASWNSHSLSQAEADAAARMRKKWGSAQKPVLVSSSHNHSRKDVTKGFKRLIKFGRKSRGETLADWISATTSEGDDDTEDGRDPASRSSDDLRKSRMGFSHGHPSDDVYNEGELFNEQVQALHTSIPAPPANFKLRDDHVSGSSIKAPRSFFSLSNFRSKGGDSKTR